MAVHHGTVMAYGSDIADLVVLHAHFDVDKGILACIASGWRDVFLCIRALMSGCKGVSYFGPERHDAAKLSKNCHLHVSAAYSFFLQLENWVGGNGLLRS